MLQIINDAGDILELSDQVKIPVVKYNPLFNDPDKLFQDVSYSFAVPFSKPNNRFMKLAQLIERSVDKYVQPVQVIANSTQFLKGTLKSNVGKTAYDCNLRPNYAAINQLVKKARLTDIKTYDVDYANNWYNAEVFEAIMLDSCINPDLHNAIWFPVKNTDYTVSDRPYFEFMNFYDRDGGKFVSRHPTDDYYNQRLWANVPYYKLTYLLKNVARFLGFEPVGGFFTDKAYKNYCVDTRWSFRAGGVYPSMRLMPYMTIEEFLKQLRERLHIAMDFNLVTGQLTVETFESIRQSTKPVDITQFLTNAIEQRVPEDRGYTITLKPDESDKMQGVPEGDDIKFLPRFKLISGLGEKPVELECSTLCTTTDPVTGAIYPQVKQRMTNNGLGVDYGAGAGGDFSIDEDGNVGSMNSYPLRLIEYKGFNLKPDGKYWPDATGVELNEIDITWYRFNADKKQLIIYATMPPAVLSRIKTTDKYCFQTEGLNYCEFIVDYIEFDAEDDSDLIQTKWTCWTLNNPSITQTYIKPVLLNEVGGLNPGMVNIKSYFDLNIHGFRELKFDLYDPDNNSIKPLVIKEPTDRYGMGGTSAKWDDNVLWLAFELRVRTGQPKWVEFNGLKFPFVKVPGYYKANIQIDENFPIAIYDYFWIVY